MTVIGPKVICHKCGLRISIQGDGKIPIHYAKGTNNTCLGSLEKPRQ